MGFGFATRGDKVLPDYPSSVISRLSDVYNPCEEVQDTWPIIERLSNRLLEVIERYNGCHHDGQYTYWEQLTRTYNCTKQIAACICFIEASGHTTNEE